MQVTEASASPALRQWRAHAAEREITGVLGTRCPEGGFPEPSSTYLSLHFSAAEPSHALSLRNCTVFIPIINLSLHLMP